MVNGENEGCVKYGETCNPSARIICCKGLSCKPKDPKKLGAPGKCVDENGNKAKACAKYGEICKPAALIFCCEGLVCKPDDPTNLESAGKCLVIN